MSHFIIFAEQNTVDKCLIIVICDYFTNIVMIPIIVFVTLFHFLFLGKEIYYIQKQGSVSINLQTNRKDDRLWQNYIQLL